MTTCHVRSMSTRVGPTCAAVGAEVAAGTLRDRSAGDKAVPSAQVGAQKVRITGEQHAVLIDRIVHPSTSTTI